MNLILHPGNGKCGSTYIQRILASNIHELAKLGIGVADKHLKLLTDPSMGANVSVYLKALENLTGLYPKFSADLDELVDAAGKAGFNTLIISAEKLGFTGLDLCKIFHGTLTEKFDQIKVIYYIRRQDEIYLSIWQQSYFHQGLSFQEAYSKGFIAKHCQFKINLEVLGTIYGRKNVFCRPISKTSLLNGNLILDFISCAEIALKSVKPVHPNNANKSLNPLLCEVISKSSIRLEKVNLQKLKKILEKSGDIDLLYRKMNEYLSPKIKNEIMANNESSNHLIHKEYFPELDFEQEFGRNVDNSPSQQTDKYAELDHLKDLMAITIGWTISIQKDLLKI